MAMSLANQVVLVTGCSTGIGRALALELAQRGQRVFATARKPGSLEGLDHPRIDKLALDVTDAGSISRAVSTLIERAQRIDILINNAGMSVVGPLAEVPLQAVRGLFETNVTGLLALTQAVFPHMAAQRSGRVVNIGSVVAQLPTPFSGPYCASKAAVHMLSDVLRMELSPFGIRVIEVQPGSVRSSIADSASQGIERYREEASRYRAVYQGIEQRARASQERPMEADAFARVVAGALLADEAPRMVRAGHGAQLYRALGQLPGAIRDRFITRRFGLLGWKA
jgi:NAD(P)-dependent dehydrogenase (short-subunit alcohol dehydrogenase family)